jgi:large subunit ribosomal protein L1
VGKRGKKYQEVAALVDRDKTYTPEEAVALVRQLGYTAFDPTVELHLRMNLDPRKADQQIRGVVALPQGTGKKVRVLVFAEGEPARAAEEVGADFVGSDDLIAKIQEGWFDFDVALATPQLMGKVGRLGRLLGTRGLMPSPKTGTIVQPEDLANTIDEIRKGRVEYRLDRTANIHLPIGKASFTDQQLLENFVSVMDTIMRAKPASLKGVYIRKIALAPTMGPSVRVDVYQATTLRLL